MSRGSDPAAHGTPTSVSSGWGRALVATVLLAGAWLVSPEPVRAEEGTGATGWVIPGIGVHIDVAADGSLAVTEDIVVDFRSLQRHGILRDIPVRYAVPPDPWYDLPEGADPATLLRAIGISDVRATSPDAPADVTLEPPGPRGTHLRIRIGDPDTTVSGVNRYTVRYRVEGAMEAPRGRPELFWDAVGTDWEVPILRATATVTGPDDVVETRCLRGRAGTTDLCGAQDGTFTATGLYPGEGMSVAVAWEDGAVAVPTPRLVPVWSLAGALWGSRATVPLTVLSLLLTTGGVGLLIYRQGRDRVTAGSSTVDGRAPSVPDAARPRRLLEPRTVAVEFRPPADLRPAQLGLLVDEAVDPIDISATIVDLAVRGHLRIEEVEDGLLWFSRTDWRLVRTSPDGGTPAAAPGHRPVDAPAPPVREGVNDYEQLLLERLFADGDEVLVSDLKGEFASDYRRVQQAIYGDGSRHRWFASRPDRTRDLWLVLGGLALAATGGLAYVAVQSTRFALAAVPPVLGALTLLLGHRWMPHRTPRGSRLLDRALGFREFIATAEADRMDYAEKQRLFVGYLPYAVVFGATERWARVFDGLGVDLGAATGHFWIGTGGFDAARFPGGVADFSGVAGRSLSTSPSSGGAGQGGFDGGGVGGGFGGGGGGSW